MSDKYVCIRDLREHADVPSNGILSQTLHNDEKIKVILFGFATGQGLSPHKAPFPATLTFLKGEATLRLGADEQDAAEGTFVYMTPYLEHGVEAKTDVVMLLTMIKDPSPTPKRTA
jgi:quercetin dioxygenase-like cupin family protein